MRRNEITRTNIQRSTVDFRVSIRHKHTHTYKQAQAQTRALVFVCDMYSCLCFVYVANAWSRRVQTVDHVHFAQTVQFNLLSLFLSFRFFSIRLYINIRCIQKTVYYIYWKVFLCNEQRQGVGESQHCTGKMKKIEFEFYGFISNGVSHFYASQA